MAWGHFYPPLHKLAMFNWTEIVGVTSRTCRARAPSLHCSEWHSCPDNMLKIWASRAARAAQRSQDTYQPRVERLGRCCQGLYGLADPPSATVMDQRCDKVKSQRELARARRAFRDDASGWQSHPEDPAS